jgi:hypothetical protein
VQQHRFDGRPALQAGWRDSDRARRNATPVESGVRP